MYIQFITSRSFKVVSFLLSFAILSMSFTSANKAGNVTLNAGTNITLETVNLIQSGFMKPGKIINFRVAKDVIVDSQVVIAAGSIAKGQVVRSERAKGLGQQGFIEIQVRSVTAVDGQEIYLTGGNIYQEGEDKQALAIILGVVICILFLTIKGKPAIVPAGYQTNAMVAGMNIIKL